MFVLQEDLGTITLFSFFNCLIGKLSATHKVRHGRKLGTLASTQVGEFLLLNPYSQVKLMSPINIPTYSLPSHSASSAGDMPVP